MDAGDTSDLPAKEPRESGANDERDGWDAVWQEVAPYCGANDTERKTTDHRPSTVHLPTLPDTPASTPLKVTGYELVKELGRGGMGVVYLARPVNSERIFALKVLNEVAVSTPQMRSRFVTEGNAGLQLDHPNIVKLYRLVEDKHSGSLFLVMEYIEGENLANRLKRGPLTDQDAVSLTLKLARALAHAHKKGIIHRDLKPSNVLLQNPAPSNPSPPTPLPEAERGGQEVPSPPLRFGEGVGGRGSEGVGGRGSEGVGGRGSEGVGGRGEAIPKIADFGLARLLDSPGETTAGRVLGTPNYMAPEQARGETDQLGVAVDLYGLGATMYEMLTGRPPFQTASETATIALVASKQEPVSPRRLNTQVSPRLEAICLKCLEKDPKKRYSSAGELADELERFLHPEKGRIRAPL